jgi:predicted RNase H-like HicB family nuclease
MFVEPSGSQTYAQSVSATRSDVALIELPSFPERIILTDLEKGYTTLRPIPVKIQKTDDTYIASFEEANIHAGGDTWSEAARNLKSLILDIYDSLIAETAMLGPGPKRQLASLLRYVKAE